MNSLIIPVYKNAENLLALIDALIYLDTEIDDLEVVFVVDGSPDERADFLIELLPTSGLKSQLLLLSRNFGSYSAIRAGLIAAKGERFAVMAADLQEPVELIITFFKVLEHEKVDIVIAKRESRNDPLFSKIASNIFWKLYKKFIVPEIPEGGVDVFGCNSIFRDELVKLNESHSSLVALLFWMGFRRKEVSYTRLSRKQGKSAWTLSKKINYLMDSVFSFTDLPIKLLIRVGGIATVLSGILGGTVIIARTMGYIAVPGYTTLIATIVFFGSLNLFALGVIGSYAWRTYENTKTRPQHIVLQKSDFNSGRDGNNA